MSSRKKRKTANQSKSIVINTNNPLFQFIKPMTNDSFSSMKGVDLQELLYYVENYYLELRQRLGLEDYITFGLELEFENAMRNRIANQLIQSNLNRNWLLKGDGSLDDGAEINSPILRDNISIWNDLKKVCMIVKENATIGKNSGGHVHIGTQVLGDKTSSWLNFIKLWSVYENIIYRFIYGDYLCARPSMNRYASPMTKFFGTTIKN